MIFKHFVKLLRKRKLREALIKLMDEYNLPENVVVNFKEGKGDLYGQYFVYEPKVSAHVVIIDMYTKPFQRGINEVEHYDLDYELIDTFAHELIHHTCEKEREAKKRTEKFMKQIEDIF